MLIMGRNEVREVTASGQTVEEAVESALEQLNTTRDEVEISIIDQGKKGLLGIFGSKLSIISVKLVKNQIEEAERFILEVTRNMDVDVELTTTINGNHVQFEINGEIGRASCRERW